MLQTQKSEHLNSATDNRGNYLPTVTPPAFTLSSRTYRLRRRPSDEQCSPAFKQKRPAIPAPTGANIKNKPHMHTHTHTPLQLERFSESTNKEHKTNPLHTSAPETQVQPYSSEVVFLFLKPFEQHLINCC